MIKKIIVISLAAVMIFCFAGCGEFGLRQENESLKAEIERLEKENSSLKADEARFNEENSALKASNSALKEGNNSVKKENSGLKEENSDLEKEYLNLTEEYLKLTENDTVLSLFDIAERKIYSKATIKDSFSEDRVIIVFKKNYVYPVIDLSYFGLENAKSLEYYITKPSDLNFPMNPEQFRQEAYIILKEPGKENVLKAIEQLEKIIIIKQVTLNYIGQND